uniref:Uncharacterized protein n=1 Tax=Alexandrium catenella TaxID=2925 RepID=A0A7S1RZ79_ALECA|mmetsp:Transcript_78814/g.209265  ORF Transcript_78814/g.209265 Transcript_78814/m.209265 type:complete len:225 (+) Transcript_78814:45-719(+)
MSLAGQLACAAGSSMAAGVGQAIGKPLDGLVAARAPGHSEINWVDFNYPPLLRLVHFSLDELPSTLSGLVRCFNISFQMTALTCVLNVISTSIIVMSIKAPPRWLLQSALHLLLLPAAALAVFYGGYRGLAEPDSQLAFRFKVAQPALAFAYLLLGIVPWGCANGLAQLGEMKDYTDGSVFWVVVIIAESSLWLANATLAGSNVVRAHHHDLYGSSPSAVGTSF